MDMIERMARTLCGEAGYIWEKGDDEWREYWKGLAIAALKAVREPTSEMVETVEHASRMGGIWSASSVWQAMIDTALAEGREG